MSSFLHSFHKYLLHTYWVLDMVLGFYVIWTIMRMLDFGLFASTVTITLKEPCLCTVVVSQSLCPVWLCDPLNCSIPGFPVLHRLPEFAQTCVHWAGDAIQPSRPLSSPSPPAFSLSQHRLPMRWLFALGDRSIGVSPSASVLPMNIQG